jgi:hypothetical protein
MTGRGPTSYEEFLRATDEIISPVVIRFGYSLQKSEKVGSWNYVRVYSKDGLTVAVILEAIEFYTCVNLGIKGGLKYGLPLMHILSEIGREPDTFLLAPRSLEQMGQDNFIPDLQEYARLLEQKAQDLLSGETKVEVKNGRVVIISNTASGGSNRRLH